MAVAFSNLSSPTGLQKLNEYLLTRSYITGYQASKDDIAVYSALSAAQSADYVNVARWFKHIDALLRISGVSAEGQGVTVQGPDVAEEIPVSPPDADSKAPAADDDDDDVDLFGEETEEEKKAAEERADAVKASTKKKESGKSSVLLDVKPWDDETDMKKLEEAVRSVQLEGLLWGASKLVPVGYGIKKLQIMMTIVDDLVSVDTLIEERLTEEPINEYVQSCDIVAFNKICFGSLFQSSISHFQSWTLQRLDLCHLHSKMNHDGDRPYYRQIPAAYRNLPPLPSSSSSEDDEEEDLLMEAQSILCDYLKLEAEKESKRRRRPKRRFIERDFKQAANTVHAHYFCENPKYTDEHFRQRFRMKKQVFFRIEEALMIHDRFFQQRPSASYRDTISPRLKVIAALRMLCYGVSADSLDEYLQLGKTTTYACLDSFCEGIYEIFGGEYLREPNEDDLKRLLNVADIRNFPGMLGSLDCMHWKWKNCPKALHGAHKGHADGKTVILEAVASYDTWIWHAQFGIPGSNNDLNVLDKSRIFDRLALGKFPTIHYQLNGKDYNWGYYLGDGIYPNYSTIIKGFSQPANAAQAQFTKLQSAYRKDVERAFGILQARFAIVRQPARSWSIRTLAKVMKTCIILHNMIVEDERDSYKLSQGIALIDRSSYFHALEDDPITEWEGKRSWNHEDFWSNLRSIKDEQEHYNLRNNLVAHVWSKHGGL